MNNITLIGRLVKDPEIRYIGESQSAVSNFVLAVDRKYKTQDGSKNTDFINVEVWGKRAEVCNNYLTKGSKVSVEGELRIDKFKDSKGELRIDKFKDSKGEYKSYTKVKASNVSFLTIKKNKENEGYHDATEIFEEVINSKEISDESLPF